MSYSSLYGIKKDYTGEEIADYRNSWLFSPMIWEVLPEKYIPGAIATPYGFKKSILGLEGDKIWELTNRSVNVCDNVTDMICWELSNQQIFFTKDKKCIAESIRAFVDQNKRYGELDEEDTPILQRQHIINRFMEIAKDIEELDNEEYPYFVFKNTSVDDSVERWFMKYNEEKDEYENRSLRELDEYVTEFVVIENGEIKDFIPNIKFNY